MEIVVTPEQMEKLVPQEDVEFVKKFKEINGHYPKFRELQQSDQKVGDLYPEHSKKDIKLKTYVDKYLSKFRNYIIAKLSLESGEGYIPGKLGSKRFVTIDGKHILRSELEVLTYNIFVLENVENQIDVDSNKFLKSCNKVPDFVWEKRKLIIEVAGMSGEEYNKKIEESVKCFEQKGYEVIVIHSKEFEKRSKYVEYYLYICKLLDLIPNPK